MHPGTVVDAAVSNDLPVRGKLQFSLDEPVGELPRFDRERADIARHHFVRFAESASEDDFEHSRSAFAGWTMDERHQVGIDGDRWNRGRNHREHGASDVDSRARTGGLTESEVLHEQASDDVHRWMILQELRGDHLRTGALKRTLASPNSVKTLMHHQPGSNSYQRWDNLAEVGAA